MRVFKELKTDGYVFFGKTKFDLDHKGVSVIQAVNLDARKDSSSTNGAGKSLLMGLIPEIFYDAVPSGKDVKAPSSVKKAGSISMRVGKDEYVLDRVWGKKKSFEITKNGEATKVRTLALATERAKQLIGLTEEEFYTTAYIDVNKAHPLVRGTSIQRRDYFTSLFRLQDADAIRKLLLQELSECEKAGSTYKELVETFKSLKGETGAASLKELKARREKLSAKALRYIDVSALYSEIDEVRQFKETYAKLIDQVAEICEPSAIDETLKELKVKQKRLTKALEECAAYEAEQEQIAKATRKADKLLKELKDRGLTTDIGKAEKGHRLLAKAEARKEVADRELKELSKEYDKLLAEVEEIDNAKVRNTKPVDAEAKKELRKKIDRLEHDLEHSRKFGKGACPTCGQDVEARPVSEIKQDLKNAEAKLKLWQDCETYNRIVQDLEQIEERRSALTEEESDETLETKIKKYRKYDEAYALLSKIVPVPEASVADPGESREVLERRQEKTARKISVLDRASAVADKIKLAATWSKADRIKLKELGEERAALESSARELAIVEAQIESETEKIKKLREIRDRAQKLKAKAEDIPVLKALLEVYSNKGLKKLMIQRYASVIQEQLNKFRSILFSEDFSFELIYDTQFHVLVHRKYGKRVVTSDVRKLSGAEGRGFTLLLLLATLTLIPRSRRLNFLVLDEADSNMGPDMLKNFQRFIPVLNKVIPHIVVVTPKPDVDYTGARYFTVVKQNGRSKLMKGRSGTWR